MASQESEWTDALSARLAEVMNRGHQIPGRPSKIQSAHDNALLVAGFCRQNVTTQLVSTDIVDIIVALCTVIESWNTELKGDHIVVKGTDNDTIEFIKDDLRLGARGANYAASAYGIQPASHGGVHQWELEIVQFQNKRIFTRMPLAIGLVTGDMNKERKDINTYFGGLGSKQFELALCNADQRKSLKTYWRLRAGEKRIKLQETQGEGDVIGITLDLNVGSVSCTINGQDRGGIIDGLPKNKTYHLAASLTGNGTTLKIVSYEILANSKSKSPEK